MPLTFDQAEAMTRAALQEDDARYYKGAYLLNAGPSARGSHMANNWLRCPQLGAFLHDERLDGDPRVQAARRMRSPPLIRGSLMHTGAAHFYRRLLAAQRQEPVVAFHPPEAAIRHAAWIIDNEDDTVDPAEERLWAADYADEAVAAIEAYSARSLAYDRYRVLAVEIPAQLATPAGGWTVDPAVTEYITTARIDLVVWEPDGLVYFDDHKTRGRVDPRQERGYHRSLQFQLLWLIGQDIYGEHFGGVRINYFTLKHADKERKRGAAGDFKFSFERALTPYLAYRQACFGDSVRWREYTEAMLRNVPGLDPWRYPKVNEGNGCCEHRYGPCPAADLCDRGPG